MALRTPVPCHTGTRCNAGVAGYRLAAGRGRSCGSGERNGGVGGQWLIGRASGEGRWGMQATGNIKASSLFLVHKPCSHPGRGGSKWGNR